MGTRGTVIDPLKESEERESKEAETALKDQFITQIFIQNSTLSLLINKGIITKEEIKG